MTQQIINIGSAPNDGTGDPARTAFDKSNQNFTELYQVSRPTGNAIEFQFNNTTTEPPATGQLRFNQATQASTTKIWVSHTTSSGVNIKQFLAAATTGAKLVLQDKIDNTNYIKFDVTGAPIDKTTYWEFAVAVTASGGNLPNAAILAAVTAAAAGGGGSSTVTVPQGRLTLQTGVPVMTTTQAAKTTIFYALYVGNQVPIYDGTNMVMTAFTELSNVTTASSTGKAGPAAVAASSVYDLFVWNDAGTVRLTRGPAWTNDTTQSAGTALVRQNGIWLNNATITNGPAASRGTYVGTVRSNASSQIDWIYPSVAANWGAGFFNIWNAYNRVDVDGFSGDTAASWTYAVANVWRAANNNSTARVSFVRGLAEDSVSAIYYALGYSGTAGGTYEIAGVGLDTTTSASGFFNFSNVPGQNMPKFGGYNGTPDIGFHYVSANEKNNNTDPSTWYGVESGNAQTGMSFHGKF